MYEELEYEFMAFIQDIENGVTFGKYFDEDEYEGDYSHNEINEYQSKFVDKVKEYLHENVPGKYIVSSGYCVFVMTIDEAKKRLTRNYEDWLVF